MNIQLTKKTVVYEQTLSRSRNSILGIKANMGNQELYLDTIYIEDAIRLRDFLDKWIEKEHRKELTDEDVNLLKDIQYKIGALATTLGCAIDSMRDRRLK